MERIPKVAEGEDVDAMLQNPFNNKTYTEMVQLTEDFLDNTKIEREYHEHIRKGAFLAQDPQAFTKPRRDNLTLDDDEFRALRNEEPVHGNKWDHPFILYALVICCSLGAAVQGWDETAVNQAQIFYAVPLGLGDPLKPTPLLGLVNVAPYLCCAVAGCWLTDPLNHWLGRRGTIFLSCLISFATCLAQGFVTTWQGMFIARFCLGFGLGPKSATVPIYAAESAPKRIRGALVMMWQMWTAFGIMLGYVSGVIFESVPTRNLSDDLKWRLTIASPMVLPLVVCAYVFTLPESPRWLLGKAMSGKTTYYRKAFDSLTRLRCTRLQAARDLFNIYHMLLEEEKIKGSRNRFIEMFTLPRNRRALTAGVICMFMQQFCGVNVLAYYSSLIFRAAGFDNKRALLASMGFGIINFAFAFPAVPYIDSFGRRNLLLIAFPFMAVFHLFTGLSFLAYNKTVRMALVTTGMYLFSVSYSFSEGPIPFLYSSECMPLYVRALGMSIFTATTWLFNFVLGITFPSFFNSFGALGTFCYYGAWCLVGFVLILLFVPETGKSQSLEELDARFSITSKDHAMHGIAQLKYFMLHHVLRRKMMKPKLEVPTTIHVRKRVATMAGGPRKIPMNVDVERLAPRRKF